MDILEGIVNSLGSYFDAARRGDNRRMDFIAKQLDRDLTVFQTQYSGKTQKELATQRAGVERELAGLDAETRKTIQEMADTAAMEREKQRGQYGLEIAGVQRPQPLSVSYEDIRSQLHIAKMKLMEQLQQVDDPKIKNAMIDAFKQDAISQAGQAHAAKNMPFDSMRWDQLFEMELSPLRPKEMTQQAPESGGGFRFPTPRMAPGAPGSIAERGRGAFQGIVEKFKQGMQQAPFMPQQQVPPSAGGGQYPQGGQVAPGNLLNRGKEFIDNIMPPEPTLPWSGGGGALTMQPQGPQQVQPQGMQPVFPQNAPINPMMTQPEYLGGEQPERKLNPESSLGRAIRNRRIRKLLSDEQSELLRGMNLTNTGIY